MHDFSNGKHRLVNVFRRVPWTDTDIDSAVLITPSFDIFQINGVCNAFGFDGTRREFEFDRRAVGDDKFRFDADGFAQPATDIAANRSQCLERAVEKKTLRRNHLRVGGRREKVKAYCIVVLALERFVPVK